MKITNLLLLVCLLFTACKTTKEGTAADLNNTPSVGMSCENTNSNIVWYEVLDKEILDIGSQLSSSYKMFGVNNQELNKLFQNHNKEDGYLTLKLPLVINNKVECFIFELEDSKTMSKELQLKMGFTSYKGIGDEKFSDVRIDYSPGTGLKGYFKKDRQIIILEPVRHIDRQYYVVFDKTTSNSKKNVFEK